MFVECFTNNGRPYLRLARSVRITKPDGRKVSQKQPVFNIGSLDRFDDGQPDYVERLKKSFKEGEPLIPTLKPYCTDIKAAKTYHFSITHGTPACFSSLRIFSHVLLERILEELGLDTLFSLCKELGKSGYDVYGFFRLLIYSRFLRPASEYDTVRQNGDYFEPPLGDHDPVNVYDTLDVIYSDRDRILREVNTNLIKKAGRSPDVIYYSVADFSFETDDSEDDISDAEYYIPGRMVHNMNPLCEYREPLAVRMGLFVDNIGIPIAMEPLSGNTVPNRTTLCSALEKSIDGAEHARFVRVDNRGGDNYPNLMRIKDAGNGYIVAGSLLNSTKEEQAWAYSDDGYVAVDDDFKYKSKIAEKTVIDRKGNKRVIEEKIVVYRSAKSRERADAENRKFQAILRKLRENTENLRLTATQVKSLRRFYKEECPEGETDNVLDVSKIRELIDFEKAEEYFRSLGYSRIATSELNMDAKDVIDKYHELPYLEGQFRAIRGNPKARSFFVRTQEHLTSHILLCLISLIMLRIMQKRIIAFRNVTPGPDTYRNAGLNIQKIREALLKWKVGYLADGLYRFTEIDTPDLMLISGAFGINSSPRLYRMSDLKGIKAGIKVFT